MDKLKRVLGQDDINLPTKERYELTWVGKQAAYRTLQAPSYHTLAPVFDDSVNFDTTQNLFIESDNLEALKLLQKSYYGQVKMIYIDPPYNTGNDFVYNDNFRSDKKSYQQQTGEMDANGNYLTDHLFKNKKEDGHYHSNWLSMMLPRLHLARNLLSDDGVIFISIDDNEQAQLKLLCDEVFGAENFRNQIAVKRGAKSVQAQFDSIDKLGIAYEYILVYTKNSEYRLPKFYFELNEKREGNWNNHWRGTDRPTMRYEILGKNIDSGQWRWSKERSEKAADNYKRLLRDLGEEPTQENIDKWYFENGEVDLLRLSKNDKLEHFIPPTNTKFGHSLWTDLQISKSSVLSAINLNFFDNPKNPDVIKRIIKWIETDKSAIILDFFAGSSTTAHAVMQLNAEDGGNRQFIMVQLPEPTDEKSEAYKAGFANIAEISKERIRRAGAKIQTDNPDKSIDTGFKVFKLAQSNFKQWQSPKGDIQSQLALFVNNVVDDASDEAIVCEIVLRLGLPLTVKITKAEGVYWLDDSHHRYAVVVNYLNDFGAIIAQNPIKIVALDRAFKNDVQKSNTLLQCQDAGIELLAI